MVATEPVFQHETRLKLFKHITAHPGVTFNVLKNIYNLTEGTLRYHLDYLIRVEKIRNAIESGQRCYYPIHMSGSQSKKIRGYMKNQKLSKNQNILIDVIRHNPGINQKELVKKSRLNRFTIRNNIEKLVNMGMIIKQSEGNMVCYEFISPGELEYEMIKTIIVKLLNGEIDENTFFEIIEKKREEEKTQEIRR